MVKLHGMWMFALNHYPCLVEHLSPCEDEVLDMSVVTHPCEILKLP